jgi:acyl-CoA thioesterase I
MKILNFALVFFISYSAQAVTFKKIVILGDSITEGYGVSREKAFPSLLQKKIDKTGKSWQVINSGISGSTTASAVSRVQWHMKQKPDLLVIALGANDGLRGIKVNVIEDNLNAAVLECKKNSVRVILAGMKMPANYGPYAKEFDKVFKKVADKNSVPLIPFLLENVGGVAGLNLEDGIHPNEKGHALIANTVFKAVEKQL